MKARCTGMIQEHCQCHPNGVHHHLLDQRRCGRWSRTLRPCCLCSSKLMDNMNTSLEERLWVQKSTQWSYTASAILYTDIFWRSGVLAIRFFIMTMQMDTCLLKQIIFFMKSHIPLLSHLPCSSDVAPCDFFLFLHLKRTLQDCWFNKFEEIQTNAMR